MFELIKAFLGPVWTAIAGAGLVATVVGGIWLHGDVHGRGVIQAKWDAAIAKTLKQEADARAKAEKQIKDNPKGTENDPNNRDNQ